MATASGAGRRPLRQCLNERSIPEDRVAGPLRLNAEHTALKAASANCIPNSTHRSSDAIFSQSGDSGYASTSHGDGYANQGRVAPEPSPTKEDVPTMSKRPPNEEVTVGNWPLRVRLKCFQRPVPISAKDRLVDFKVLFAKQLVELVSKYSPTQPDISLQLRWLGRSENEDLSLFLVVQCDKAASRAVKRFFNQVHVREQFEPEFLVHVLAQPPKRLGTGDVISVWTSFVEVTKPARDTVCGIPIHVSLDDKSSCGTMGGVIMTRTGSNYRLYGMTSAHIFEQLQSPDMGQSDVHRDDSLSDDDDFDEFELDLSQCDSNQGQGERDVADTLQYVGQHRLTSTSYDWGLVDLDSNFVLPNKIGSEGMFIVGPTHTSLESQLRCWRWDVTVLTGGENTKHGFLTGQASSLLIGLGNEFVEIYDLTLSGDQKFTLGDSGSWVVILGPLWACLVGYVVGVSAFGDGYVVPIQTAMDDIKNQLQVDDVFLPSAREMASHMTLPKDLKQPAAQDPPYGEAANYPYKSQGQRPFNLAMTSGIVGEETTIMD